MEDTFDSFKNYDLPRSIIVFKENENNHKSSAECEDVISELNQLSDDLNSWRSRIDEEPSCPVVENIPKSQEPIGVGFKLNDPPNINEILNTDEALITPSSHNVGVINVACQQILKEMEQQLLYMLKKNNKEQEIVKNYLSANGKINSSNYRKKPGLKCLGMPYFKDLEGYPAPLNGDVLKKKNDNKLLPVDFLETPSVWGSNEIKALLKAVNEFLEQNPEKDINSIDWMMISATNMNGKYSPSECKSKWMMNLRSNIKKSRWGLKEIKMLEKVAEKHHFQNWDKIAEELGTNRTGFQCCIQYQTRRSPNEGKWTKEEDERLKKVIEKYKVKDYIPWPKVTWYFETRSLRQCQERYIYHLINIKKGGFTMEEDFVLVYLAKKLNNFGEVAKYFPKRVSTQLRARYEYLVKIWMPEFTKEEDELLMKLMALYPRNWDKISEAFKDRSKLQCRGRWASIQKEIKFEKDVASDNEPEDSSESPNKKKSKTNIKSEIDLGKIKGSIRNLSKVEETKTSFKKSSAEYEKLLDYHKHCYKFLFGPKPRLPCNSEENDKLVQKMKMTMSKLSVADFSLLKDFDVKWISSNCEFDEEDLTVLCQIRETEDQRERILISDEVIPPNYMTLVGVRTLFVAWNSIRNLCEFYEAKETTKVADEKNRLLFSDAKKLFKSRMKSLFLFPLLLSNISPREIKTKPVYKPKTKKTPKAMSKRRRKKHAKFMREVYTKKLEEELNEKISGSDLVGNSHNEMPKEKPETAQKRWVPQNDDSVRMSKENKKVERKRKISESEEPTSEVLEVKRTRSTKTDKK